MTVNVMDLVSKYSQPRRVSTRKGGEYACACPGCGDGGHPKKSDRFHIWPSENDGQGGYWCRQCNRHGDAIQFLRDFEGLGYREACERLGIEAKKMSASYIGPKPRRPPQSEATDGFTPDLGAGPPGRGWREHAEKLIEWAHLCLMRQSPDDHPKRMLLARGIREPGMKVARLGWIPGEKGKDIFRPRESWGLPTETKDNGQPKRLWIPKGVSISMRRHQVPWRIRIRRDADDPRYYVIPGSNGDCWMRWERRRAYVIVEAELDAILIEQEADDLVGVAALGSSSRKPDARAWSSLAQAAVILNALDYDAAGEKASKWWERHLPQTKRWPVPAGKDPGDAFQAGVDIRAWVRDGLPPGWA